MPREYGRRYTVAFHFDRRKKVGMPVQARSVVAALSKAHKQLLGRRLISNSGYYQGKLPRSVTVTRISYPVRKKQGASESASL